MPGPEVAHSFRSYQCEARRASHTSASVCPALKTWWSRSQQISTSLSETCGDLGQRVGRELGLGDRVVLELEIGRELHQLRPVGTRARTHRSLSSPPASTSLRGARPRARRPPDRPRTPARRRASGRRARRSRPSSPRRRWKRPSASGSSPTSKRTLRSPFPPAQPRPRSRRRVRPRECPHRRGARAGVAAAECRPAQP